MTDIAIELVGVTKRFAGAATDAVTDLHLAVPQGSLVALIGPSGCGKTTTLRMVNRLVEPTRGQILLDGADVTKAPLTELRRSIGYVIQQVGLFPHHTVARNIAAVPDALKWDKARTAERVEELADLVGIDRAMLGRYPDELSGGQQQRVGVARALAADPPVLLMDEPFGAVDPIVRTRLQDELLNLQERVRKTILLVTHDIDEAVRLADRVALLDVGGVLAQYAPPDELLRSPADEFVERFVGADRALKRLALLRVGDLDDHRGPVLEAEATDADARATAEAYRSDWVGRTTGGRFDGWVNVADLGARAFAEVAVEVPAANVSAGSSLRQAMELIMTSDSSVAVVSDEEGRFRGVVTLERIRAALAARPDPVDGAR